jgi:hypothetical protein
MTLSQFGSIFLLLLLAALLLWRRCVCIGLEFGYIEPIFGLIVLKFQNVDRRIHFY